MARMTTQTTENGGPVSIRRRKNDKYIDTQIKSAFFFTIMDTSLGTVIQFEHFVTHAKLYPRVTNIVRPYPLPHPTDSVETVKTPAKMVYS